MKITNLRPVDGAGSAVARFDVELDEEVILLHWQIKHTASGLRVFAPAVRHTGGDGASASLSPALYRAIQSSALDLYSSRKGAHARGIHNAA